MIRDMYQLLVNNLDKKGNERFNFNSLNECYDKIDSLENGDYIIDILELNKVSGNYMVTETINIDKKIENTNIQKLINEFYDYNEEAYFNFWLDDRIVYSTMDLVDFLLTEKKKQYTKITVTPF